MAITNPTKYVTVQRLNRFKQKTDAEYASQDGLDEVRDAIGYTAEFVDLGLPSGTLWAKCNIGAESETGYGNYYMYGKGDRQYNASDDPYAGTEDPLASDKDTATVVLGAPWHMPTKAQFEELLANTTYSWEENFLGSGINGGKYTAQNGKYLFFPAAGDIDGSAEHVGEFGEYWSSTPYSNITVYNLEVAEAYDYVTSLHRSYGFSVRPVCDTAPLNKMSDKADKKDTYTKSEVDNKLSTKSNINHNHDSRYYTESEVDTKLSGKANTSHTHDDRYYQKSQTYARSEVYTKKETEGYVQSKFGLKYDAENRAVIVPVASVATYQKSKRMIDFTGIAY